MRDTCALHCPCSASTALAPLHLSQKKLISTNLKRVLEVIGFLKCLEYSKLIEFYSVVVKNLK